jgi:class 3 adenylate cyclase
MYVDPDLARTLLSQPQAGRLGGRRRDVAVLMADIRGFTPMTEKIPPEETVDILNRYFSAIIPLIQHHRGIIVDFIGDGILAFFEPFEETLDSAARRCLQCAFAMQDAMNRLNEELTQHELPDLAMGIGINCGPVVVGNIGSEKRKKYGIVGSAVNITQRIQGQSHADEVVISEAVYRFIRSDVVVSRTFSTALKGVASEMQLYAVYPNKEPHQE